jgi:hypothetical protein
MAKLVNRDGKMRFYESTATPFYLEFDFDAGDFSGPLMVPLTDEMIILDRGKATADIHHIEGPENKIWEPSQITFSGMLQDSTLWGYILQWVEWLNGGAATINSNALVTTKGDTARDGVVTCPAFADSNKRACNIEILWDGPTTDLGMRYSEVFIPGDQVSLSEGEDAITLAFTGLCYGLIARISAFTSGTSIEA